ncbi:hypothetical protein [Wolbachia endosymbiont of Litomosoides brasiliensis]|nr:hypothetical protein [Wolbachia endosymbiont of Litomosoides brasiliensis]
MSQIIVELFNCRVKKRGNKFSQIALKQSNCIIDFIVQSVPFYIYTTKIS